MVQITIQRYRELLLTEKKMILLQAGGVDNWNNYWDSLHDDILGETLEQFEKRLDAGEFDHPQ